MAWGRGIGMMRVTNKPYRKTDIINRLGQQYGLRHYLELCTATTGHYYANIDRGAFETTRRMMYRSLSSFDDGLPVDYRCAGTDIEEGMAACATSGIPVDICLVDGFHSYNAALRDLRSAYDLLKEGGFLVVHDCLPITSRMASPTYINDHWCGEAYKAFLDFVLQKDGLNYCTVNCDMGCGINVKNRTLMSGNEGKASGWKSISTLGRQALPAMPPPNLIEKWQASSTSASAGFAVFQQHKKALMRMVSVRDFVQQVRLSVG